MRLAEPTTGGGEVVALALAVGDVDEEEVVAVLPGYVEPLTRREQEILRHLGSGASNGRIAQHLNISRNTVASHLRSIYQKTGFTSRMEAVLMARRQSEHLS